MTSRSGFALVNQDPVGWCGQWGGYTDQETVTPPGSGTDPQVRYPLVLLGHRYYDPGAGRFLNRDPVGMEGGVNVYAYCVNNPVNNIDPSGLDWIEYTGQTLTYYKSDEKGDFKDRTHPVQVYAATSGLEDSQDASMQSKKDHGPIPSGKYTINLEPDPLRFAKPVLTKGGMLLADDKKAGMEQIPQGFTYHFKDGTTQDYGGFPNWGLQRACLTPMSRTKTHGRSGFYIHDSDKGYSHGCVETEKVIGRPDIFALMKLYRVKHKSIKVQIRYTTKSTRGRTGKRR